MAYCLNISRTIAGRGLSQFVESWAVCDQSGVQEGNKYGQNTLLL